MGKEKESERRWGIEEPRPDIVVPTLREKNKRGLSDKVWIMGCYQKHKGVQCFREYSGQELCSLCPKSGKIKSKEKAENIDFW